MATPQFNIRLDSKLKEDFLAKAKSEGKTGSDLIVTWIAKYVRGEEDAQPLPDNVYTVIDERVDSRVEQLQERLLAELEARLGKRAA